MQSLKNTAAHPNIPAEMPEGMRATMAWSATATTAATQQIPEHHLLQSTPFHLTPALAGRICQN